MKCLMIVASLLVASAPALPTPAEAQAAEAAAPTRFSVEVIGEGPDVILIPGLLSPRSVWDAQVDQLKGSHRLHLVEIAGFGTTPAGPNAEGDILPHLASEIAAYIASEGLEDPAIIGHSMGGFTGLILSLDHPEKVGKLMIVDSLPFFSVLMGAQSAEDAEAQAKQMRDVMIASIDADAPAPSCDAPSQNAQAMSLSPAGQCKVDAYSASADLRVGGQLMYEIMTTDMRARLAEARVPTVMLFPFADPYPPEEMATRLYTAQYANHPAITMVPVADSRHFIMFDQPDAFAEQVKSFLGE